MDPCTSFIQKHLVSCAIAITIVILCIPPPPDDPGQLDVSKKPGLYGSETTAQNLSDNILVWIQISDVHVQSSYEGVNSVYYRRFLQEDLPMIDPTAVIVTGDFVESLGPNGTAETIPDQWEVYRNLTSQRKYKGFFVDVIGNHDVYGAVDYSYPENYTVSGKEISKSLRKVTLGGVNTPEYNLLFTKTKMYTTFAKAPFGDFDNDTIVQLKQAVAAEAAQGRPAVVIAHHPLGVTSAGYGAANPADWLGINDESSGYTYHISGHMHDIRYNRNHRMIELTAGHLMDGNFRILVYDNYLLSFNEVRVGEYPFMVLTYPKSARFLVDDEPNSVMVNATQIRVAAYSDAPIKSINVTIDDQLVCSNMERVGDSPLYKCDWDSSNLVEGIHDIVIIAVDEKDRVNNITDVISLSGHYPQVTYWMYRIDPPVRLFWVMVTTMAAVGLFLILPKITYKIQSKWNEATLDNIGATSAANETVGPVAISWIARITIGHSTIDQFFDQEVLSPLQKAIVIVTYQIQSICVKFWATPNFVWVIEMVLWIYGMVGPAVISVHEIDNMCSYPFFSQITNVSFVNEGIPVIMAVFHLMVLLPICAFVAECSFSGCSRVPSGPVSLRDVKPSKLTWWTGFLLVISVVGTVGVYIATYLFHGGTVVVTSPICYISAVIALIDILFFITALTSPKEVSREFDHPGVHFQQLPTIEF